MAEKMLDRKPSSGDPSPCEILACRRQYAESRLGKLKERMTECEGLTKISDMCIYVTGSYGRLEASQYSDLDLFFVRLGSSKCNSVPRIQKTLVDADLIRLAQELGFQEFSNDGEYLAIHYLEEIKRALGGREDDWKNYFTARLLLLLESRPIYNDRVYQLAIRELVECYFRDYHGHEACFRPIFLMNDILLFWRTMCLNYEHKRNLPVDQEVKRNKSHLRNLKLKFSRMLTCYSAIAHLAVDSGMNEQDKVLSVMTSSPMQRLDQVASAAPQTLEHVNSMKHTYAWFLSNTARKEAEVLEWIGDRETRRNAFDRGRKFADEMYAILGETARANDAMRFLVI